MTDLFNLSFERGADLKNMVKIFLFIEIIPVVDIVGYIITIIGVIVGVYASYKIAEHFLEPPSGEGRNCIAKTADEILPPLNIEKIEWNDFDLRFINKCIDTSMRGIIFKGAEFQDFIKSYPKSRIDLDRFLSASVKIYIECSKKCRKKKDRDFFNKISQIYLEARLYISKNT